MGWFVGIGSEVKVAGEGVKAALDSVGGLANSIRTAITGIDPEKQMEINKFLVEAEDRIVAGQQALNILAIQSGSFFQSGWRPAAGWLSVFGLAYSTMGWPLLSWLAKIAGIPEPPIIDTGILVTLLVQMLGLGALRTYERKVGKEKN